MARFIRKNIQKAKKSLKKAYICKIFWYWACKRFLFFVFGCVTVYSAAFMSCPVCLRKEVIKIENEKKSFIAVCISMHDGCAGNICPILFCQG